MKDFKKLGRSLSNAEQKSVFGGLDELVKICTCENSGKRFTCYLPMAGCLSPGENGCGATAICEVGGVIGVV